MIKFSPNKPSLYGSCISCFLSCLPSLFVSWPIPVISTSPTRLHRRHGWIQVMHTDEEKYTRIWSSCSLAVIVISRGRGRDPSTGIKANSNLTTFGGSFLALLPPVIVWCPFGCVCSPVGTVCGFFFRKARTAMGFLLCPVNFHSHHQVFVYVCVQITDPAVTVFRLNCWVNAMQCTVKSSVVHQRVWCFSFWFVCFSDQSLGIEQNGAPPPEICWDVFEGMFPVYLVAFFWVCVLNTSQRNVPDY